jgi:hypothetical protein
MNTIKKFAVIALLPVALLLSGCAVTGAAPHSDPKASAAAAPSPSPKQDSLLKGFGQTITYTTGVSVSVSAPSPYTPSEEAAGVVAGQQVVQFNVVVTNNSADSVDIAGYPQATSGGQPAHSITDLGANVGNTPMTTLLAGQSLQWAEAFSVANPADVTFQYAPVMTYKTAIFDSKH